MARVTEEELERVKEEISLVRLVESNGIKLDKKGSDYHGCCPFHDDKTPSLVVTPSKNLFHCFGCGAAGSVVDWVMKMQGISFRHAVELLKKDELPQETKAKPAKRSIEIKLPPLVAIEDHQALLHKVIDYYHQCLKESPEAIEYLEKRGLNNPELIEKFKLGYANRTLAYRLPQKNRAEGAKVRGQLQEIGILRESGHEHFNGSLVVPVINSSVVNEVYGRKIKRELRKGTPKHLYLPGEHQGVWNSEALEDNSEIILCESLIDAMTFWVHGFRNVTTSYGTNGFTDGILNSLVANKIEKVLIAYDRDKAGDEAVEKLVNTLTKSGIDSYRIQFPKGMDANEYALKVTPAEKSLDLAIRKAEWIAGSQEQNVPEEPNIIEVEGMQVDDETGEIMNKEPSPLAAETKPETKAEPQSKIEASITDHEINIKLGERSYRIRGMSKNSSYEQLKINIMAAHGDNYHIDTIDMYNAKQRYSYINRAAIEMMQEERIIKTDIGKVLLKLERLQDEQIKKVLEPGKINQVKLSEAQQEEAINLLRSPDLIQRILSDFNRAGIVGEETNKLVGYLAGVSRKLDKPLAIMIQSTSAAGKTSLMDSILNMMPEEESIQYSAMTGQSLYYMGEKDLKNKILAIAEEEGAENASYALKLLQSEGEVTMASTGKNSVTGNLETQEYRVEGPVSLFYTTTSIDIDEELLNRCIVLTVDESREQTEAIHVAQRRKRTLEGLHAKIDQNKAQELHANAQRLLKPLMIINPYADELTFLSDKTRTRRDHEKYLGLIDAITLLHQYQRQIKRTTYQDKDIQYIEVTLDDIALANQLAHEVLGRSLDELPPQTRKLLQIVYQMVMQECEKLKIEQSDYHFSRKQIRDYSGWGNTQLKIHLSRLEEMEYLIAHKGSRGRSYEYEMLYSGEGTDKSTFIMGLLDIEKLKYDKNKSGLNANKSPLGRGAVGAKSGCGRIEENLTTPSLIMDCEDESENLLKSISIENKNRLSYVHEAVV